MSIVVKPVNQLVKVSIEEEKEKVVFSFMPLDYKTKAKITNLCTSIEGGQLMVDSALQVFFNIKHALKNIEGVTDEQGEPYKLEFEGDKKALTDKCVDELLATVFSDNLQYVAREFSQNAVPNQFRHPLTGEPLKGVDLVETEANRKK